MSLSLDKFQKLLSSYDLMPMRYFEYHERVMLIEVLALQTGDLFVVYVPKGYDFRVDDGDVYTLKRVKLDPSGEVGPKYAQRLNDLDMSDYYDRVDLLDQEKLLDKSVDVEKELIDQYRRKIMVSSSEESAVARCRELVHQLERMSQCVDKNYGLAIITNSLLVMDREHIYMVRGRELKQDKAYVVVVDLESLFKNITYVGKDVPEISRGIQRVLNKNHQSHMSRMGLTIDGMVRCKANLQGHVERVQRYSGYVDELVKLVARLKEREASLRQAIRELNQSAPSVGGEIAALKKREALEKEAADLLQAKGRAYEKVVELHRRSRDTSLALDKLLFENLVMMVSIQRNLSSLIE